MSKPEATPQVEEPFPLSTLRHSVSHLMASAVAKLYPGARFGFGPAIENGFYYDLDLPEPLTERELRKIEKEMRKIAKRSPELVCTEVSREDAKARFVADGQDYKVEAVDLIPEDEAVTIYKHGDWEDLCEGPHVDRLDRDYAFKLLSIAGAYWRGDEKRPMLQRIYGTAFWSKEQLDAHLAWLEEVKLRDHRRLGTDLDLYSTHEEAGAGFIFWHPNLGVVRRKIEEFWWELHEKYGYKPVYTPHVSREQLFAVSGHLENYEEMMYAPMAIDELPYRVKPMNCPGHILIYLDRARSYRELPMRWAELGTVYRYEKSGQLSGMLRVRGFTQDDSHIFCTPAQLTDELAGVLRLVREIFDAFGFEITAYLATRPEDKAIGSDEIWEQATDALRAGAAAVDLALELDEGGGAFYGPKIDFKVKDALGREWQNATVQCDFNLPERFDMTYTAQSGERERPILVHRAILGSFERFVGVLIEHYGGKFPVWLAPTQVALIPIRENHEEYARQLETRLREAGLRVDHMDAATHMNKRIKQAQHDQVPFMLITGDREAEEGTVALRRRGTREQEIVPFEDFLARTRELVRSRSQEI